MTFLSNRGKATSFRKPIELKVTEALFRNQHVNHFKTIVLRNTKALYEICINQINMMKLNYNTAALSDQSKKEIVNAGFLHQSCSKPEVKNVNKILRMISPDL